MFAQASMRKIRSNFRLYVKPSHVINLLPSTAFPVSQEIASLLAVASLTGLYKEGRELEEFRDRLDDLVSDALLLHYIFHMPQEMQKAIGGK